MLQKFLEWKAVDQMAWFNPFFRPGNTKRNFHRSEIDFTSIKQVKINRNATETILLFYNFFLPLVGFENNKIELHIYIPLPYKCLPTTKKLDKNYLYYLRFRSKPVGCLGVFLSNIPPSFPSTSYSILSQESWNRSVTSQSAMSTRKGRLWYDCGLRGKQKKSASGRHFV